MLGKASTDAEAAPHPLFKLLLSIRQRGVVPTLRRIGSMLPWQVRLYADRRFDRKHGVDTAGLVAFDDLGVNPDYQSTALHYEPTPAAAIRAMLRRLPIRHSDYTFVDYGSGKGRVLLVASLFPFRKIIGVEFSAKLHAIAESNIRKWQHVRHRCKEIVCLEMSAEDFPLPDGPVVLFFFTPFRPPVSTNVIGAIRTSLAQSSRAIEVRYYGMDLEFIDLLQSLGLNCEVIYDRRPLAALGPRYTGRRFTNMPLEAR